MTCYTFDIDFIEFCRFICRTILYGNVVLVIISIQRSHSRRSNKNKVQFAIIYYICGDSIFRVSRKPFDIKTPSYIKMSYIHVYKSNLEM